MKHLLSFDSVNGKKLKPDTFKMPEILSTPIKSLSDKKDYRVLRLENGLKAILISDMSSLKEEDRKEQILDDEEVDNVEESEGSCEEASDGEDQDESMDDEDEECANSTQYQAAASLCVGVGGFEDPSDVPGLMHFLEHMVFMGSEKYPKENHFDSFTKKHGGDNNAHTDTETTTFYFNVQEEYFKKTLDVFSQFFKGPLMKKDAMKRERDAVHSEFQLAKQDDGERAEQLFSSMAVDSHPMGKFFYGNEKTLNLDISDEALHKRLHQLRKSFYSGQYMTLAVQARESLDTLQEWVVEVFSEVPNNGLPRPSYGHFPFPFPKERIHSLYKIIPVKEFNSVELTWALPPQQANYRYKALNYLSHLIGDEGVGSILSYFKKRDWSIGLMAGNSGSGYEENTTCSIFSIAVSLTDEGFKHLEEVMFVIFQYLKLLQNKGPLEWVFKELQQVEQLNFDYETECSPIENVEDISESMQIFPPEHYLTGDSLLFEFNANLIQECLSALSPTSCNVAVFSKEFKSLDICKLTEQWYGTEYCVEEIPSSWVESWANAPLNPELQLPEPNEYIPDDFSLFSDASNGEYPQKILQNSFGELWFKQDKKYLLPRAFCHILFRMESVKTSARMCALLELFLCLLQQQMQEKVYPVSMAKYSYRIESSFPGFSLKISGFNQKLEKCLSLFLSQICEFPHILQELTFEQMKKQQIKVYHNATISPSAMRTDVRLSLLQETHWHSAEKLKAVQNVSMDEFLKECVNNLLPRCDIRMLVQGNVNSSGAERLFNLVCESRVSDASFPCPEMKTRKLRNGSWCARLQSLNKADVNSSVINYYQAGIGTMLTELINEFIVVVMEEPVFDYLRTREQLGYCVYCTNRNTNGILGISITVDSQADKFSVDHVNEKIEEVLREILVKVKEMPAKEFAAQLETMKNMKLTIDLTLEEEVTRNWSEIVEGEYAFDRLSRQVELIPKITQSEVASYLDKIISSSHKDYRKLSVQVVGSSSIENKMLPSLDNTLTQPIEELICLEDPSCEKEESRSYFFIKNLDSFKKELEFYPITKIF